MKTTRQAADWTVEITGKAQKQRGKLPEDIADALLALWTELKLEGPVQPEWPHYGKLKGRKKEEHHCHLNKGRLPMWLSGRCWINKYDTWR